MSITRPDINERLIKDELQAIKIDVEKLQNRSIIFNEARKLASSNTPQSKSINNKEELEIKALDILNSSEKIASRIKQNFETIALLGYKKQLALDYDEDAGPAVTNALKKDLAKLSSICDESTKAAHKYVKEMIPQSSHRKQFELMSNPVISNSPKYLKYLNLMNTYKSRMDLAIGDSTKFPDYFTPKNLNKALQNEENDNAWFNIFIERQDTLPKLLENHKENNIENIERVLIKAALRLPIDKKDPETATELTERKKSEEKFSNFIKNYRNILTDDAIKRYNTSLDNKSNKVNEIQAQIFDKSSTDIISNAKTKLAEIEPTKMELQNKQAEITDHKGGKSLTERAKKNLAIEAVDKAFNDCQVKLEETRVELKEEIIKYSDKAEKMTFEQKKEFQEKLKEIRDEVKSLESKFKDLSAPEEITNRTILRAKLQREHDAIIKDGKDFLKDYNTKILEKNDFVQKIKSFESTHQNEIDLVRRAKTMVDGSISALHEPINKEKNLLNKHIQAFHSAPMVDKRDTIKQESTPPEIREANKSTPLSEPRSSVASNMTSSSSSLHSSTSLDANDTRRPSVTTTPPNSSAWLPIDKKARQSLKMEERPRLLSTGTRQPKPTHSNPSPLRAESTTPDAQSAALDKKTTKTDVRVSQAFIPKPPKDPSPRAKASKTPSPLSSSSDSSPRSSILPTNNSGLNNNDKWGSERFGSRSPSSRVDTLTSSSGNIMPQNVSPSPSPGLGALSSSSGKSPTRADDAEKQTPVTGMFRR